MEKRLFTYVVLGMFVWAFLGTIVAGYYFVQYNTYQTEYNNLASQLTGYNNVVSDLVDQLGKYNDIVVKLGADIGNISNMLEGISLKAKVLINYGNETKIWHNNTVLPLGSTSFTAVYFIAQDINYTDYGGELGILVTSISTVTNNSTHGWFYWYWNSEKSEWILPEYSCSKLILHKEDIIAFSYSSYMNWPPSPPT